LIFTATTDHKELRSMINSAYPTLNYSKTSEFMKILLDDSISHSKRVYPSHTPVPFTCNITGPSPQVPTSVHQLRPADIKVLAAVGDSLTAGFGALADCLLWVFTEYRGVSWSIGGDQDINSVFTLGNIFKQYNPNLQGFSVGTGGQDSEGAHLNLAVSGARAYDLPGQAFLLIQRLQNTPGIDYKNDWKMVTVWIGGNDLCDVCDDDRSSPANYEQNVLQTLRILDTIPRVFVNLVLNIDVTRLYQLDSGLCTVLHYFECYCPTSSDDNIRKQVSQDAVDYNNRLSKLRDLPEFNDRDDFTIVIQPFYVDTQVPLTSSGEPDYDYFAPDCFHFSFLSHEAAAVALWNNMIEPVGSKKLKWTIGEPVECPSQDQYFFTNKNSMLKL